MLKPTALYNSHAHLGAKFFNFAGWNMPLHYGSQVEEHKQVRNNLGMFDVSHMRVRDIVGLKALDYARYLLSNDVQKLEKPGKGLYSCMLNDEGGIIDDVIVYYVDERHVRIVSNAGTSDKVYKWMSTHAENYDVSFTAHNEMGILAVQGPNSVAIVANTLLEGEEQTELLGLSSFEAKSFGDLFLARTGYTGEDGVEIILPVFKIQEVWQKLLDKNVHPIGLGARDSLRLEAGLNLYGNEMDDTVTPYECGLSWTVTMNDRDFIGKEALIKKKENPRFKRIAIVSAEKGRLLRQGQEIYSEDKKVGIITSGAFSPISNDSIAFARIDAGYEKQEEYDVNIRGKVSKVKNVKLPFRR